MTSSPTLDGKAALVTGGGSGLGLACALELADRGARVVVTDVRASPSEAARQAFAAPGRRIAALQADNRVVAEVEAAVAHVVKEEGRLDILVNNAGVSGFSLPIEEIDEAAFDGLFGVHVKGAFFATRAAAPIMKAQRFGRIINISSNFAMSGYERMSHYVAAKAALLGLTKAWAREFGPFGVTVNAVAPGLLETPMTLGSIGPDELAKRAQGMLLGRLARPQEIAFAVAWLASDEAAMMTGQTVSPNGGASIVGG